jgi:hypothetical protein
MSYILEGFDDNKKKKKLKKYNLNKVIVNHNKNVKPTLLCHLYLDDKTTRSQGEIGLLHQWDFIK